MDNVNPSGFPAIVPAQIGEGTIQTTDARRLHSFLGVGKDFSTWFRDRVDQYGFAENVDFVFVPNSGEYSGRGQPPKEYAISLDMAKEMAMVERNEKGKQARRYFIECERRANDPALSLSDPARLRGLLLVHIEREIQLEGQIEEMRPHVQALERIALSDGSLCITDTAKTLQIKPKALFDFMKAEQWIYTRQGDNAYIAYQVKLQQSLLEHKTTVVTRTDGSEKTTTQVRVTPKGLAKLATHFPPPPAVAQAA